MKPDFFKDEDIATLPYWVRLLYEGLWTLADSKGRLEERPVRIKAELFPYDKVDIMKGLDLLAEPKKHSPSGKPFIVRYQVESGENYIEIVEWGHQPIHHTERDSVFPAPSEESINRYITVMEPLRNERVRVTPYISSSSLRSSLIKGKKKKKEGIRYNPEAPNPSAPGALGSWEGIAAEDLAEWRDTYPAVNIEAALKKMIQWLKSNPAKARKSNWRRFITTWLTKDQDKGGDVRSAPVSRFGRPASTLGDWAKRKAEEEKGGGR